MHDIKPVSVDYWQAVGRPAKLIDNRHTLAAKQHLFLLLKTGELKAYGVRAELLEAPRKIN